MLPPRPPRHPYRSQDAPLAPKDREQRPGSIQEGMNYEEEVNSRGTQPEDNYFPPPPPRAGVYDADYFPRPPSEEGMHEHNHFPPPYLKGIPAKREG
ncbi:UNVERIFIED_CONTAM: hypothetical protein Sradi_3782400 [Sesamum radiatum]|uniref:Uncharacterized protein n=1 Tax=Sesamum radiatum TaxID=300843 RepID=A0AAW2PZV7_SESRA